jgi:hypothetical protein
MSLISSSSSDAEVQPKITVDFSSKKGLDPTTPLYTFNLHIADVNGGQLLDLVEEKIPHFVRESILKISVLY